MIFVSHSMQQVSQVCSSVLLLKSGAIKWYGNVSQGVAEYATETTGDDFGGERALVIAPPVRTAHLTFSPEEVRYGECLTARLELDLVAAIPRSSIRIVFYSLEGLVAAEWDSSRLGRDLDLPASKSVIEINLGPIRSWLRRVPTGYVLNDATGVYLPFWSLKQHSIAVMGHRIGACEYQIPHVSWQCTPPNRLQKEQATV